MKSNSSIKEKGYMKNQIDIHKPLINTYTSYGAVFSLIGEESTEWVYNNFIQLRYAYKWDMFTFDEHQRYLTECPGLDYFIFPMEIIEKKYENSLLNFIVSSIDMGYGVFFWVDRFHVAEYKEYQTMHFAHEVFIIGYDMQRQVLIGADNGNDGKYVLIDFQIEQIEEAFWKLDKQEYFLSQIRLIRRNADCKECFNIQKVKFELNRYLNSVPMYEVLYQQEFIFGFCMYDKLIHLLKEQSQIEGEFDIRGFHLLYEHKLIMEARVKFMEEHGYIGKERKLLEESSKIKMQFLILRNTVLKYNVIIEWQMSGNKVDMCNCICDKLNEALESERKFLVNLVAAIEERENQ